MGEICPRMAGFRSSPSPSFRPKGFIVNVTALEVCHQGRDDSLNCTLERAQAGEQDALCDLMEGMTAGLLRAILRRVRLDSEAARSILQDAWVSAWQRLAEFRSASHLWSWVYRASVNRAISHIRHERVEQRVVAASIGQRWPFDARPRSTGYTLVDSRLDSRVPEEVASLPASLRPVAALHLLHGLGIDEVATLLGLSGSAARMRLHRARTRLRRRLTRMRSA